MFVTGSGVAQRESRPSGWSSWTTGLPGASLDRSTWLSIAKGARSTIGSVAARSHFPGSQQGLPTNPQSIKRFPIKS